jgi:hypothetical protein
MYRRASNNILSRPQRIYKGRLGLPLHFGTPDAILSDAYQIFLNLQGVEGVKIILVVHAFRIYFLWQFITVAIAATILHLEYVGPTKREHEFRPKSCVISERPGLRRTVAPC